MIELCTQEKEATVVAMYDSWLVLARCILDEPNLQHEDDIPWDLLGDTLAARGQAVRAVTM